MADVYKFMIQGMSIQWQGAKTKGFYNGDDDQMGMFSFRCKCAREASKVKKDICIMIDVRALAIL